MQDFQTLVREHDELDALCVRMIDTVAAQEDVATIVAVRAHLSLILESHLAREDGFLYDRILKGEKRDFPAAVDAFHRDFADLTKDWADYLRGWDAEAIAADTAEFAAETVLIITRLRARIAHENALLYPVALVEGHIRLRAA